MTPERWRQVQELYRAVRESDLAERPALLVGADPEIRREVESLLAQEGSLAVTIDQPASPVHAASPTDSSTVPQMLPGTQLGPYRIESPLGAGGMGEVFRARDTRLHRTVALKILSRSRLVDPSQKRRFLQEARAASALNHPNIVTLYDISNDRGTDFLVLEYVPGQTLAQMIPSDGMSVAEVLEYATQIASALAAAHALGIVHRDIKPANIIVTPGAQAKILDFGLAKLNTSLPEEREAGPSITAPGMVMGTLAYMSPEQAGGQAVDTRSDQFSFGALLYEMATGKRPFQRPTSIETLVAILHQHPDPVSRINPLVPAALTQAIERCLAKDPTDRYSATQDLARELADLRAQIAARVENTQTPSEGTGISPQAPVITRLIVLPFRMLRPDPEIDFLAYSLPDAITSSLLGLASLLVRSSVTASKYGGPSPDLNVIAAEADVDTVLTGTLLRSGDQLRASTQLVAAPGGALIWSQNSQFGLHDIFQLQDELVQRTVESLMLPLTARESRMLKHDVPANAAAYEYYLRANQLSADWQQTLIARDLYLKCVELDARYAPAWARLGRCYRVIAKYGAADEDFERAEQAFQRAFSLNPDLALAHNLYAHLEADLGRAEQAMVHLLKRARANGNDPHLFSGLVYACRFCGLLDASIAAHQHARRLDPLASTSVTQSYFMAGEYQQALEHSEGDIGYIDAAALASLGRTSDALDLLRDRESRPHQHPLIRWFLVSLRALLEGKQGEALEATERGIALIRRGGEELYYFVRQLAYLGDVSRATTELERAVENGFTCHPTMVRDSWLDPIRSDQRFDRILRHVESRHAEARRMFVEAGGMRLLSAAKQ